MRRRRGDHIFATTPFVGTSSNYVTKQSSGLELLPLNSLSLVPRLAPGPWLGRFFECRSVMQNSDADLRLILTTNKVIALVGWSPNPERPSHRVANFLVAKGYRVIPVNPGQAGKQALGETVRSRLTEIAEHVDMVDIFRRSEEVGPVVDEALLAFPTLKTIWMQLGVEDEVAAAKARATGVAVVMNRCPAIELPKLGL